MLSKTAIEEFKTIYLKQYGIELPDAEAVKQANGLLRMYKAVLQPPLKQNVKDSHNRDYS